MSTLVGGMRSLLALVLAFMYLCSIININLQFFCPFFFIIFLIWYWNATATASSLDRHDHLFAGCGGIWCASAFHIQGQYLLFRPHVTVRTSRSLTWWGPGTSWPGRCVYSASGDRCTGGCCTSGPGQHFGTCSGGGSCQPPSVDASSWTVYQCCECKGWD